MQTTALTAANKGELIRARRNQSTGPKVEFAEKKTLKKNTERMRNLGASLSDSRIN